VSTDWVAEHLDDPNVVVVESDEDVLLYETGHIPGAIKIDWHADLNDATVRDYLDGEAFAELMSATASPRHTPSCSTATTSTGGRRTPCGCSAVRTPRHPLMDGGRQKWVAEGRPMTTDPRPGAGEYPVVERDDAPIRAFRDDAWRRARRQAADRRPLARGVHGRAAAHADYPQEGALRGGHIPGAANVPWKRAANDDGTFKSVDELRGHLRRTRWAVAGRRGRGVLPHRRALEPHLVRAHSTCSATTTSATTTDRGPSGATPCGCRSRSESAPMTIPVVEGVSPALTCLREVVGGNARDHRG
jgi:hypothetical protein